MGGDRPFDDDRFPDEEGHACCFICGRKVDPSDPQRGSYTPNAAAACFIPIHLPCASAMLAQQGGDVRLRVLGASAYNQMGEYQMRRMMQLANCATSQAAS